MQGLIEFLARNLVDQPDAVEVREIRNDRFATVVGLRVEQHDLGKVIGRQGRVAKAMRTLMRTSATLQRKRHVGLEIDENPLSAAGEPASESEPEE